MYSSNNENESELSEYEKMRLERIKRNEEYMKSLGLTKFKDQMKPTKKKRLNIAHRPRQRVKPGEERRSKRNRKSASYSEEKKDDDLVMLSYDRDDDGNYIQQANSDDEYSDDGEYYQASGKR